MADWRDRHIIRSFPVECGATWDADNRGTAEWISRRRRHQVRTLLFEVSGDVTAIASTMSEPLTLPDGINRPAAHIALIAIAPPFRGAVVRSPERRRLSETVISTALEDARHWDHGIVHAVVHTENVASRRMLEHSGLRDLGPIADDYRRYAGLLPPS